MKARIFDIKRFAVHDGAGIRTTVFFKGCPLKCIWCHNPEGISGKAQLAYFTNKCMSCGECVRACGTGAHFIENGIHNFDRSKCIACGKCEEVCLGDALKFYGKEMTVDELLPIVLEDREFYGNDGGVTLSGGECLTQADFCLEFLRELKKEGINTAVDTCGFVLRKAFEKVIPYTDIFLYDLKAYDEDVHAKCTGRSNKRVLENLKYIDSCGGKTEIRIPYIPGYNSDQMEKLADFIGTLKNVTAVSVLPYHNYAGSKYESLGMENTLPCILPSDEEMQVANSFF